MIQSVEKNSKLAWKVVFGGEKKDSFKELFTYLCFGFLLSLWIYCELRIQQAIVRNWKCFNLRYIMSLGMCDVSSKDII